MTTKTLETVKVQDGKGGYYVMNKSEFREDEHQLYKEPKAGKKSSDGDAPEDFSKLNKTELQDRLEKSGVQFDAGALKEDLVVLAEKNRSKLK